jgi:hypothetical protein
MWNFISNIKSEGVSEQDADENIRAEERWIYVTEKKT